MQALSKFEYRGGGSSDPGTQKRLALLADQYNQLVKPVSKPVNYLTLFAGGDSNAHAGAAILLGGKTGMEVYRVDLSAVVSKYIGETEKNLAALFEKAAGKKWILFFDEADALFGKRTTVRDSHDRFANQEVAMLMEKIEKHEGLMILSSLRKENIDSAFIRRIRFIVDFAVVQK